MPRSFLVKNKNPKFDRAAVSTDAPHDKINEDTKKRIGTPCEENRNVWLSRRMNISTGKHRPVAKSEISRSEEQDKLNTLQCLTMPRPICSQTNQGLQSMLYQTSKSSSRRPYEDELTPQHIPRTSLLKPSAHSAFDSIVQGAPRYNPHFTPVPQQTNYCISQFEQLHQRLEKDAVAASFCQREHSLEAEVIDLRLATAAAHKSSELNYDEPLNLIVKRQDDHDVGSRLSYVESNSNLIKTVIPTESGGKYIPKKKYFLNRPDHMGFDHVLPPAGNRNISEFGLRSPFCIPPAPSPRDRQNHLNRLPDPDNVPMLQQSYQTDNAPITLSTFSDNTSKPLFDTSSVSSSPVTLKSKNSETHQTPLVEPKYRRYLVQHLQNIRSGIYQRTSSNRLVARQPVLGLEYVQNSNDVKVRDVIRQEGENGLEESAKEDAVKDLNENLMNNNDDDDNNAHGNDDGTNGFDKHIVQIDINGNITTDASGLDNAYAERCTKQSQPKKYKCDICFKEFSRSNTLVTHKRIHTGDRPFKCELCGRDFRQPGNLTRHGLIHTTFKPYSCPQCDKAFNRASNLHTHIRTHTNYRPFTCSYCGKGFHQKIDMKIHSYTHTGEKPHKCNTCGRGFKQLTHLTYHMRIHSTVKMYTCTYCGKGFNQKGNLQAHIYGHTGERPYRCEVCDKGFTLASTLNTHRRTHVEKKPLQCQYCQKEFYQNNALKSHLIASHPCTGERLL